MSTFHDDKHTGVAIPCGELLPATGGGFTFVPNKSHEYLNIIQFENPDKDKVLKYLEENGLWTTDNGQQTTDNGPRTNRREPAVGEIFEYKGRDYKCTKLEPKEDESTCHRCDFKRLWDCCQFECAALKRKDNIDVIFQQMH